MADLHLSRPSQPRCGETPRSPRLSAPLAGLVFTVIAASSAIARGDVVVPSPRLVTVVAPPAASPALTKGPYLQALGPTAVTVKVELASPGPASVAVVPAGADAGAAPVATRASTEARSFHTLRVDGLTPATAYEYRVTSGRTVSETGHFTTAPGDARPFRFLVYGDSRTDPEAHAAVVRAMEGVPSDFLINTGDMVEAGNKPELWAQFFAIEGRLLRDRCAFAAVGNHELSHGDPTGEVAFLRYFAAAPQPVYDLPHPPGSPGKPGPAPMPPEGQEVTRLYGSFRWANTRFFVLNAMDTWTGDERAWLRAELDRAAAEPGLAHRIAVMHWGPYSSGPHGNNPALESGEVTAMMRDHKVDLLLAGHDHVYERGDGHGLKYVITGGAGAPLYPRKNQAPETRYFESAYNFVDVAVDGDHVSITARRPTGAVLETCGYQGSGPWDCDPPPSADRSAPAPAGAVSASASPAAPPRACGCAVPGALGERSAAAALAIAATLAWRRRKRE